MDSAFGIHKHSINIPFSRQNHYSMPSKVFQNMNILVIESDSLTKTTIETDLVPILMEHGADRVSIKDQKSKAAKNSSNIAQYSHVIAQSVQFLDYSLFEDAMIPVVTRLWVDKCVSSTKLAPLRPYSPDPKLIFKDLVVTVALSSSELGARGDMDLVYSGVRLLGGQISKALLLTTTHLVTRHADDDLALVARECNENGDANIKIVGFEWIDDCFKMRRLLDETPYLLGTSQVGQDTTLERLADLDVRKSHVEKGHSRTGALFLSKFVVYLGRDLELSALIRSTVANMVQTSGGDVATHLDDPKVTAYLGKYRDGAEYVALSRRGLVVGNLNWFYYMVLHGKWILPTAKLLHYPYVRGGLPGFDSFVIGVTNYTGDGRFYLESLIELMGGKFTKNLRTHNTHLICAKAVGDKYELLRAWRRSCNSDIKIVNHLWLEESYRKWKILEEEFPRFKHFPRDLDFQSILGQTSLDVGRLKSWYTELGDGEVADSLEVAHDLDEENVGVDVETSDVDVKVSVKRGLEPVGSVVGSKKLRKNADADGLESDKASGRLGKSGQRFETDEKLDEKPGQSPKYSESPLSVVKLNKRNASVKAAEKLHSDMEDLNLFQKRGKKNGAVGLPELDEIPNDKGKSKSKSKLKIKASYDMDVIVTGCEKEFELSDENVEKLSFRGVRVVDSLDNVYSSNLYLVAPKVLRTEKFLTSLSFNLRGILVPEFLSRVLGSEDTVDALDFQLKTHLNYQDPKLKDIWSHPSSKKIDNLLNQDQLVFADVFFVIYQSNSHDQAKNAAYQRILKRHGCKECEIVGQKQQLDEIAKKYKLDKLGTDFKILSKKKIGKKYESFTVDYDWIVKKIMMEE